MGKRKRKKLDGGYDSVDYYAFANM